MVYKRIILGIACYTLGVVPRAENASQVINAGKRMQLSTSKSETNLAVDVAAVVNIIYFSADRSIDV